LYNGLLPCHFCDRIAILLPRPFTCYQHDSQSRQEEVPALAIRPQIPVPVKQVMMMRNRSWTIGMTLTALVVSASSAGGLEKKLIHFGWDLQSPTELVEKIGDLQYLPFDGLTVRPMNFSNGFQFTSPSEAAVLENVEAMTKVKWGKFTDNFMYLVPGHRLYALDWFDERAWADDGYILTNVRALARMGQAGKCKGILFDPEAGDVIWDFQKQPQRDNKGIAAMRAIVRQRGVQVVNAIEREMPAPVFLTLFWSFNKVTELADILHTQDPQLINDVIERAPCGLLHDFMLGILQGADKGTMIVDGNEASYYSEDFADYNTAYHYIRHTMLGAVPRELRYKYRAQVHVGHAIFADLHHNTRGLAVPSTYMTPKERALTMEWIVYHCLKNSDQYAWFYTEKPQYLRNVNVPPEMLPAIERARQKVARNEPIGFNYKPLQDRSRSEYYKMRSEPVEPSKAVIVRAVSTPKIDGKLDDELWQKASQLGPFRQARTATNPVETKTQARMAYDNVHLYIAFDCDDPAKLELNCSEIDKDDQQRGNGHMVEIGIAADKDVSKYYHIRLTHANRRWDSLTPIHGGPAEISGNDSNWDAQYKAAIDVAGDRSCWSVELAIPWSTLNRQAPRAGEEIKGNLILRTDRRPSHANYEFSSWSEMRRTRIIEANQLGSWQFQ
jgi:hypothetical protein